jgi:hypothetical protein
MTTTLFNTSKTATSTIWTGFSGDGVYVASGVALTDLGAGAGITPGTLVDESGSATAQIYGSVTGLTNAIEFDKLQGGGGVATIQIGSTGSVTTAAAAGTGRLCRPPSRSPACRR